LREEQRGTPIEMKVSLKGRRTAGSSALRIKSCEKRGISIKDLKGGEKSRVGELVVGGEGGAEKESPHGQEGGEELDPGD